LGPNRFAVRVHVGRDPVTGKLRQVSRVATGIAGARRLRAKLVPEVAHGKHGSTVSTLGSLLDEWLAHPSRTSLPTSPPCPDRRGVEGSCVPERLGEVECAPLVLSTPELLDARVR